ncbi:hypothetical protein ONE63_002768 [Megalurothrips usitatus]|uniref:DNA repair protein complementing XP-G cells homolog n=1 Tax=Megalurothrips usitatus TaxID=439358 RepID=A0AAV7X9J7_9NEOP|nr:hypothetical protein ONE63_002768 [Megalurothrips usitatus]
MGVHGLWKLLEAAGKPVPLESLENKVLAVDVSIWLHQMMKGFQDSRGAAVPNAHLLGLFHRVCKLMYYRIKPVFVFDGGVPLLKRQTIAARKKLKQLASQNAADAKAKLLKNLVQRKAVRDILNVPKTVTGSQSESVANDDMFHLPPLLNEGPHSESEDEASDRLQAFMGSSNSDCESEPEIKPSLQLLSHKLDLHTLDVHSEEFCSLPPDVRHDILSELKETRKQNSWGRLHEMPEESGEFSSFQLGRLLKRRNVQCAMEKAEKEMGGKVMRMNELQELMEAQGVDIIEDNPLIDSASQRIASDSTTRFVLCKDSSAGRSSQDPASSKTLEVKENPLYNEQVEFIAQMAENMLQQIEKKKQEKDCIVIKEEKEEDILCAVSDGEVTTDNVTVAEEKILVDDWSSDDDTESKKLCEGSSKAEEKTSPKRKFSDSDIGVDSMVDLPPASKVVKLNSDNSEENHVKQSSSSLSTSKAMSRDLFHMQESNQETHMSSSSDECEDMEEVVKLPKNKASSDINVTLSESQNALDGKSGVNFTTNQKKPLEIIIQPGVQPDSDDIFADVFEKCTEGEKTKENKSSENSIAIHKKPLEIVISPGGKPAEDDLFADIFQSYPSISVEDGASSEDDLPSNEMQEKMINASSEETSVTALTGNQSDNRNLTKNKDNNNPLTPTLLLNNPSSSTDWKVMEASLEAEELGLQKERGRQERLAASITDQMCVEAQELLQLFGLPYLVAPMEAEAQCAFLDAISLTEGSITDDSDIWLFGGKKVYKNFFNQKKHVLQFTSTNIDHYFKLSREQLVQLALLVGSDYTTGIQGIGPVTALEIIAAFRSSMESDPVQIALKGLGKFRDWWNSGRPHRSNHMRLLDRKLKNLKFAEGFPNQAVVEAYLRPAVDDSQEAFSWGALDLPALREYAKSKFGWPVSKTDEILLPVAKKWTARSNQRSIDSYFNFQPHLVEGLGKMSKRVQKAVTLMENDEGEDVDDPAPKPSTSAKGKQKGKQGEKKPSYSRGKTSKNVRTKKKQNSSDSDSATEANHVKSKKEEAFEKTTELPVRAPTVPRQRTSTGVKRIGSKAVKTLGGGEAEENTNTLVGTSSTVNSRQKAPSSAGESHLTECGMQSVPAGRKTRTGKAGKQSSPVLAKRAGVQSRKNSYVGDDESEAATESSDSTDTQTTSAKKHTKKTNSLGMTSSRVPVPSPSLAKEDMDNHRTGNVSGNTAHVRQHLEQMPSSSRDDLEGAEVSSDLAALSEMNWEDDPWDMGVKEHRPKVFFGGTRPNRPWKPAPRRPTNSVVNSDSRGMQPGSLTQERLESRIAWVDALHHRKKEESIPQREQDQRAMEDAKMKAIQVVKASGVKQAERLLGKQTTRKKGKVRPTSKILTEHDLSESSSDE